MIGKTILNYKILEKLGEGGMGVVYKAEDTKLEREVALKFLPNHLTDDEEALNKLLKEAKAASKINHNNVCTIYDIKEHEDTQYIVMEYVEGETLKNKIKTAPLSLSEAVEYSLQICNALKSAHDKDIIHRDIKSENIMINMDNVIKVMDFGLARIKDEAKITKTSTTAGTIAYMAPEQIKGEDIDHRVDIWSLGVVLYEMLTDKFPFKGEYEAAMSYSIVNTEPDQITDIPEDFQKIIRKTLKKNPDERYQNAGDILKGLKKFSKELECKISEDEEEKPKPSIAVLPFTNMSNDPDQEYFCDGMSEEIINALTHIENLKVIARTSAFMFKGKHEDMREIGKKLDVEHLLEGSVRKAGNRLRITAQLIKVKDGSHLWSERYDREFEDVFEIQDEISLTVVKNLKLKILGEEKQTIIKHYTDNVELYNLYLLGRFHWNKRDNDGIKKSIEYYEQALAVDPDYALAYAGLADAYLLLAIGYGEMPKKALQKAKNATEKAIELDDLLPEAHNSLAYMKLNYDFDRPGAEVEFKRAIELNPGFAQAYQWYSQYFTFDKRYDEAHFHMDRALELDPLSIILIMEKGWIFYYDKQYEQAVVQFKKVIEMNPELFLVHFNIGCIYVKWGLFEEAFTEIKKSITLSGGNTYVKWGLVYAYYMSGQKEKAEKALNEFLEMHKQGILVSVLIAVSYALFGNTEKALEWLDIAYEERNPQLSWMNIWITDALGCEYITKESRYIELMKKVGIEI